MGALDADPLVAGLAAGDGAAAADHRVTARTRGARRGAPGGRGGPSPPGPPRCRTRSAARSRSRRPVSSSIQPAVGIPSRGWPTLPGLSSTRRPSNVEPRAGARAHRLEAPVLLDVGDGEVGVAVQARAGAEGRHRRAGDRRRGDVLPGRVARAAVDQQEPLALEGLGLRGEPGARLVGDGVAGPLRRPPGVDVELTRSRGRRWPPRRGCRGRRSRPAPGAARRPRRGGGRSPRRRPGATPRRPRGPPRGPRRAP